MSLIDFSLVTFLLLNIAFASTNQVKLYPEDFGDAFQAQFSDRNLTYDMKRPMKEVCNAETKVLLLIFSGPDNFDRRQAIRQTWLHDESNPEGYPSYFIIGQTNDSALNEKLITEQEEYGDILRYSAIDTYVNVSYKTHAILSWHQAFCSQAPYVMKIDDDVVIDLKRFDHFVRTEFDPVRKNNSLTVFGNVWSKTRVIRNPKIKYFVPFEEFEGEVYPPFCQGPLMLFTVEAGRSILAHTKDVHFVRMDDALFTGIVAERAQVQRYHAKALSQPESFADEHNVPYMCSVSGLVSVPESRIAYKMLKELKPDSKLQHEYHWKRLFP